MAEPNRFGIVLLFIIFLLLTPDSSSDHRAETELILDQAKKHLFQLQNSTYGVPGNITGFEDIGKLDENGIVRALPPTEVRRTAKEMMKSIVGWVADDEDALDGLYSSNDYNMDDHAEAQITQEDLENKHPVTHPDILEDEEEVFDRGLGNDTGPTVKKRHQVHWAKVELPFFSNATGSVLGSWYRAYDTIPYKPPNSTYDYGNNVTGSRGKIEFTFHEQYPGQTQEVNAIINVEDENESTIHNLEVYGYHFPKTGDIVLTTMSKDFAGEFAVPHFALTRRAFEESRGLLNRTLSENIMRAETEDDYSGWPTRPSSQPKCDYIAYVQLHPVRSPQLPPNDYPLYDVRFWYHYFWDPVEINPDGLHRIEKELRFPTGAPIPAVPRIVLSATLYSPTCGHVLRIDEAKGLKQEQYVNRLRTVTLIGALLMAIHAWLLVRQMNESSTPSTVSRVSFWSIVIMTYADGLITFVLVTLAFYIESISLVVLAAAFSLLLSFFIFGLRFLVTIWRVQQPEWEAARAARRASATSSNLPAPVTASAQTPLIPPTNTNTNNVDLNRQAIYTVYTRFYIFLVAGMMFGFLMASWPLYYQRIANLIITVFFYSFWVPQIYRNIMRGCRKALTWEYVIGTSVVRLLPPVYMLFCPENIFNYKGWFWFGVTLVSWVAIQIAILWVQEWAGPRIFIPGNFLPPVYDYHPILSMNDLEAAQLFSASTSPPGTSHSHSHGPQPGFTSFHCAICMNTVDVLTTSSPGGTSSTGGLSQLTARRSYMVTPCRHVFHTSCLEGWMRYRLQCPVDRNQLPPL